MLSGKILSAELENKNHCTRHSKHTHGVLWRILVTHVQKMRASGTDTKTNRLKSQHKRKVKLCWLLTLGLSKYVKERNEHQKRKKLFKLKTMQEHQSRRLWLDINIFRLQFEECFHPWEQRSEAISHDLNSILLVW